MTEPTELELLKDRADDLGIDYHPSIGLEKLKAKVNAKLNPIKDKDVETKAAKKRRAKLESLALKRVLVMNQNPAKKDWKGEYIKVSNSLIGTVTKFVPYDIETHIETIIYKQLKQRKMSRFYTTKNAKGRPVRKWRLVPEFAITDLEPLTEKELKALAADQAKRGAIGDDE